ncbi:hypothetical protein HZ326_7037 [Fusarium oxysporum f. sp. albedinis]|nr:hypothetical protein HZ326_7037 [Fusarium oxysporum f. sp. albedinis]
MLGVSRRNEKFALTPHTSRLFHLGKGEYPDVLQSSQPRPQLFSWKCGAESEYSRRNGISGIVTGGWVAAPYTRIGRRWQVYGMVDAMQRDGGDRNRLEFPVVVGG